jgi:hypothetical protein
VNKVSTLSAARAPRVTEHDNEEKRVGTVGISAVELKGKAREFAMKEFFAEQVPSVRGEKVIPQRGLPDGLELVK